MKGTQITQFAYKLTRFRFFNCYLLLESDGLTLIDTGFPGAGKDIVAAAEMFGESITRIALTHAHGDHVGSVDELAALLNSGSQPALQVAASGRSVPLLRQPPDVIHPPGEPGGKIKGSLPGMKTRLTTELKEGETFASLRVIETPGHIPGHLSYLDERDGTLFAGDALTGVGGLCIAGYSPWYFPMPNMFTWNKALALESVKKLLTYRIERFATGHGLVRPGGQGVLKQAVARASSQPPVAVSA